jgi:hypothetical protein
MLPIRDRRHVHAKPLGKLPLEEPEVQPLSPDLVPEGPDYPRISRRRWFLSP